MKSPSGRRRKPVATRRPAATHPGFLTLAALLVVASLMAGYLVLNRTQHPADRVLGGQQKARQVPPRSRCGTARRRCSATAPPPTPGRSRHQSKPEKLKPGEKPPQFVVFSWDGALENDDHLFSHFRKVAEQNNAHMTFFLSGIYLLPKGKRSLYKPAAALPRAPPPSTSRPTSTSGSTLEQLRQAWEDGNEIGTHFNGHFCGPTRAAAATGASTDWKSEIAQAYSFVENWKTNTGFTDIPPLPFDYAKELVGGRAPCLEGQKNLLPAAQGDTAGATTPARPATSRSGRRRRTGCGTSRSS